MSSPFSKSVSEAPSLRWLMHWQHRATATCATVANHRSAQLGAYISSPLSRPASNPFSTDSRVVSVTAIDRRCGSSYEYTTLWLAVVAAVSYTTASLITSTSQGIAPSA